MTYLILLFLQLWMGISLQGDINLPQPVLQSVLGTLDLPELKLHSILYFKYYAIHLALQISFIIIV